MNRVNPFNFAQAMALAALLAGCSHVDEKKSAAPPEKPGVVMDAETQKRIGVTLEFPKAGEWQPEITAQGHVIEPATLTMAAADVASADAAADVSAKEYERQKTLSIGNNISTRSLEAAAAASARDSLAAVSARAKFSQEWGAAFDDPNARTNLVAALAHGETNLVQINLPVSETPSTAPASARIVSLSDETNFTVGTFFGATTGVNVQTQSRAYFFAIKSGALLPGTVVTAFIQIPGQPTSGVVVPYDAVLRHTGTEWVYVETETNRFVRERIVLNYPGEGGWFVSGGLSATNRIVVAGAQTVLSAELSQGSFDTGQRD